MANAASGCGQDLNRPQHITIFSVNPCSLKDLARLHQQFDMRFVQIVIFQEL